MSINFNRNRTQETFEKLIGIVSSDELLGKKDIFKHHRLTDTEASQLLNDLKLDAIDFFYNGILSFSEGIDSIFEKRFSWATVMLYYSIFYSIRSSMASKGIATLRCGNMYRLKIASGECPFSTTNKKYNTTHEGTINHYKDLFSSSDKLLSNKIGDFDAYEWMMNAREIVNYRSRSFLEPGCLEIWQNFYDCLEDGTLVAKLLDLENDSYVKCFQEEYAVVAIPIKRIKQTIDDLSSAGILHQLSTDRESFMRSVIKYDERSLSILSSIFCST